MTDTTARRSFRLVTLCLLTLAVLAAPAQLYAADPAAGVADLSLPPVAYSHAAQLSTGTMSLTIDSSTNSGGWHVTVLASDFVYSGAYSGNNIVAANFSITSAATPLMTSGQPIDATGGPRVPAASPAGTLDVARTTVEAVSGYGQGTYTQALGVSLSIPAQAASGTYAATLTVTAAVGP